MLVRSAVLACAAVACAAVALGTSLTTATSRGSVATRADAASAHTVRVVICHTARVGPAGRVPARLTVLGPPASTAGLVAYTTTGVFLVGPSGMACSGSLAEDGASALVVWSRGVRAPLQHSRGDGLTLSFDPVCVRCQAEDACPLFAALARGLGFPCMHGVPAGERVQRPKSHVRLFEDPPGVAGDGWPSGGPDPANGLVGVNGSLNAGRGGRAVFRSTCTLPAKQHAICTVSLDDVLSRYG
jgi:hypothetical protein